MIATTSIFKRDALPVLRQAGWRKWLVALALVCVVGIYSIEVTHHHKTEASELACPICHVMAHGAPNLLKPVLSPVVSFAGWYQHVLPRTTSAVVRSVIKLLPQPRAPPVSVPSSV
ncbi:MAG: hypothetical protein ACRER0_03030 [Gammaproteobacteria bacterium]